MPLQKYNTTSTIQMPSTSTNAFYDNREATLAPATTDTTSLVAEMLMKPSSSSNSSSCSSPPSREICLTHCLTDKVASLKSLVPNIIEASSGQACLMNAPTTLPVEIKTRLHLIFSQIEHEFDALYAENVRLQQELYNSKKII